MDSIMYADENIEEFVKFIKYIGFKTNGYFYIYKEYQIDLVYNHLYSSYGYYNFYNKITIMSIPLDDLTPLKKEFKRELRSFKLKKLLSL